MGNLPKKQTQEPLETISPIYHVSPWENLNLILDKKTVFFFPCKPNKFRVLWSGNPGAHSPNCLLGWKQTSPTVTQHCGKQACYTGFNCVYLRVYLFCGTEDGPQGLGHTKRTCSAYVREQMQRLRKVSLLGLLPASSMWVHGLKLRLSGLAASTFSQWSHSLASELWFL